MRDATTGLFDRAPKDSTWALAEMPNAFAINAREGITAAIGRRLPHLASALEDP